MKNLHSFLSKESLLGGDLEKIEELDKEIEESFENVTNDDLFKQYFDNKVLKVIWSDNEE